jgi:hypothetical protein
MTSPRFQQRLRLSETLSMTEQRLVGTAHRPPVIRGSGRRSDAQRRLQPHYPEATRRPERTIIKVPVRDMCKPCSSRQMRAVAFHDDTSDANIVHYPHWIEVICHQGMTYVHVLAQVMLYPRGTFSQVSRTAVRIMVGG